MNFQDVIRESYDNSNKALKVNVVSGTITASSQVTVTLNNTPTIYAVVNTSAAGQASVVLDNSISNIGFATVSVSNPTLYAVVNTGAAGDPKTYIGLVTATLDNSRGVSLNGNVTISDSKGYIGLVTVTQASSARSIVGNVTLSDSKTYIGLTTTTLAGAWADPKGYIGLVTVTGNFGTTGNVTLDAGSKTGIVGNITLSDAKTFIGLTTTILGNNSIQAFGQFLPTLQSIASGGLGPIALDNFGRIQTKVTADSNIYMGLATVTLDNSRNIGISGNVTISDSKTFIGLVTTQAADPKGYIGLVTVTQASSARTITGNLTLSDSKTYIGLVTATPGAAWPDPKGYIGLVTITGSLSAAAGNVTLDAGSKTGIVGNITISDSKGFIGLVTLGGGTAWADPKGYIGLVTITGSLAPAAGNVTLDAGSKTGIVGNVTLSDSKTFVGLVTVKATVADTYASLATLTISLASLAYSATGAGRQSTLVDNTSTNYQSALIYLKVLTGGAAVIPNTLISTYLIRYDNNSVADDGAGASDAAINVVNAPLLGNILVNASTASLAYYGVFDTSPLGPLGPRWGIAMVNNTTIALNGVEGNMLKNWIGVNRQLT